MVLVLLLVSSALSCASLLIVRYAVQKHVREGLASDLADSVSAFQNAQRLREATLSRSAQLIANLPSLKALMTTHDAATINDAAIDFWKLSGSDIFLLADREGGVVALHARNSSISPRIAQQLLHATLLSDLYSDWWAGAGQLYEVALQPIYFGPEREQNELGVLVVGYEINRRIAAEVASVARSQVAFCYSEQVVTSSFRRTEAQPMGRVSCNSGPTPLGLELGGEHFLAASVGLSPGTRPVRLLVLKSFDQATQFLKDLNRLLLALGAVTIVLGACLAVLISNTITGPLGKLVGGVHALKKGDYSYPLIEQGSHEVAELAAAFRDMRSTLQKAQQELLAAERMAIIGRMASSLSHDMRHQLSAIFANAEFLCGAKLTVEEREELFAEIRIAVNDMTDLVDSMLEFSRGPQNLRTTQVNLVPLLEHAIRTVKAHPEFRNRDIRLCSPPIHEGRFDAKRLERAFYNLLLNAAEAVSVRAEGEERVEVIAMRNENLVSVRIIDNGPGIPSGIEKTIFDPFIGFGKEHGSGLGLTIARKILQEHGGDVILESAAEGRTIFVAILPLQGMPHPETVPRAGGSSSIA